MKTLLIIISGIIIAPFFWVLIFLVFLDTMRIKDRIEILERHSAEKARVIELEEEVRILRKVLGTLLKHLKLEYDETPRMKHVK